MNLILKIIFYIATSINGFIGLFYLVMTVWSLISPPAPHYRSTSGVIFALGCACVVGLLAWAFQLAILQGKTGEGFGILILSYFIWVPILIAMLFTSKGSWQ
jgi:succinate dehydrogenase/fumarate reductase cytochrome b subunit